jgi:hypothetical protein
MLLKHLNQYGLFSEKLLQLRAQHEEEKSLARSNYIEKQSKILKGYSKEALDLARRKTCDEAQRHYSNLIQDTQAAYMDAQIEYEANAALDGSSDESSDDLSDSSEAAQPSKSKTDALLAGQLAAAKEQQTKPPLNPLVAIFKLSKQRKVKIKNAAELERISEAFESKDTADEEFAVSDAIDCTTLRNVNCSLLRHIKGIPEVPYFCFGVH